MSEETKTPLETILKKLTDLPSEAVIPPYMPLEEATREAKATAEHIVNDAAILRRFKIQPQQLSNEIYLAAEAANEAEKNWARAAMIKGEHEKVWITLKPGGYVMHDDYLALLEFIYEEEGMDEELKVIREIKEGNGDSDMVLDMLKISDNLDRNADKVAEYEITAEDRAAVRTMYNELAAVVGATDADRERSSEEKDIRDRAFTYLQMLVNRARRAGKIAYRRDPESKDRYRSKWRSRKNRVAYENMLAKKLTGNSDM